MKAQIMLRHKAEECCTLIWISPTVHELIMHAHENDFSHTNRNEQIIISSYHTSHSILAR